MYKNIKNVQILGFCPYLVKCLMVHINPTRKEIIVNNVLNLATFFFLLVWRRTNKGVKWVKSVLLERLKGRKLKLNGSNTANRKRKEGLTLSHGGNGRTDGEVGGKGIGARTIQSSYNTTLSP